MTRRRNHEADVMIEASYFDPKRRRPVLILLCHGCHDQTEIALGLGPRGLRVLQDHLDAHARCYPPLAEQPPVSPAPLEGYVQRPVGCSPCGDCIDGYCTMNCGPRVPGEVPPTGLPEMHSGGRHGD